LLVLINILLGHHAIPPVVNNSSSSYLVQQVQRAHLWSLHLCLFEEAFNNIIGLFWLYITVYMLCTFTNIRYVSLNRSLSRRAVFTDFLLLCVFEWRFFPSFLLFDFTYRRPNGRLYSICVYNSSSLMTRNIIADCAKPCTVDFEEDDGATIDVCGMREA
jgi:hypothetical protein